MTRIGIMQGRLGPPVEGRFQSFPRGRWREEFPRAAEAGLDCIEWIHDGFGLEENPLATGDGPALLQELSRRHGIGIHSVCADYFMDHLLLRGSADERREHRGTLLRLIERCFGMGIERIVLPFVDSSSLAGEGERDALVALLPDLLDATASTPVELHLETDLGPSDFARLLERIEHPRVRVNYDSGNSSGLGYSPREEFAAYGPRVGSVHIKDRVKGGGTVPLGSGDARFDELADALAATGYRGDYILQVARGVEGDEVAWTRGNRAFVEQRILGRAAR